MLSAFTLRRARRSPTLSPAHHIAAVAEGHDLVVMGTHGRGRLGEALAGSVSRDVVHSIRGAVLLAQAPAPVAGVPAEERRVSAAGSP